jgi:hypothetical protein
MKMLAALVAGAVSSLAVDPRVIIAPGVEMPYVFFGGIPSVSIWSPRHGQLASSVISRQLKSREKQQTTEESGESMPSCCRKTSSSLLH